jgi:23S rRNA (uracil1939-C5)-methyltransferase
MEAAVQAARLVLAEGELDLVAVAPLLDGGDDRLELEAVELADAPQRVVYVSCNPTTLAPNAAQLAEAGYVLKRVRPVDMFPQTPHVECVAVLDRVT